MAGPKAQGGNKRASPHRGDGASTGPKKQRLNDGTAAKGPKKSFDKGGKPSIHAGAKAAPGAERKGPIKLTRHEQKDLAKQKSAVLKRNYTLILEAAVLWESLRAKQTSPEEKAALVDKIMSKVDGRLVELASNHTASRVIQFLAKHGSKEQRAKIMDQVKANMVALAKSKYGHHVVRKLINVSSKEEVPDLVRMFRGHTAELLRHPQGADVLMDLYDVAPAALRNQMCAELYGREFVLFDGVKGQGAGLTSLGSLLQGEGAIKRRAVMQHMTKALVPIMEKGILHPPMVHRLLRDFIECAPSLSVEDAVDTLSATGAALLKMVHTHDGAAVVCAALGYGTARDRKRIVKAMKGHIASMAVNEWGYVVLACALSVVDDTSITSKVIGNELKAMMSDAVEDSHAGRVLLQLLSPNNSRYQSAAALAMMQLPQRTVKGSTGKMVTDVDGDEDDTQGASLSLGGGDDDADDDGEELFTAKKKKGGKPSPEERKQKQQQQQQKQPAVAAAAAGGAGSDGEEDQGPAALAEGEERVLGLSKKDMALRRRELLSAGGKQGLGAALAGACAAAAGALLRTPAACDVVVETARGGDGGLLFELAPAAVEELHDAIVQEAVGGEAAAPTEGPQGPAPQAEHVFTHYYASRALRRLLLASGDEAAVAGGSRPATAFAEKLWAGACSGRCKQWVGGHGEKVLAALLHCGSESVRAAAGKELRPLVAPVALEEWSARFVGAPGQGHAKQGGKGKAGKAAAAVAAPGAQGQGQKGPQGGKKGGAQPAVVASPQQGNGQAAAAPGSGQKPAAGAVLGKRRQPADQAQAAKQQQNQKQQPGAGKGKKSKQ